MMNIMNGNKFKKTLIFATVFSILVAKVISDKKLQKINKDPTVGQYLNRLTEFFEHESLDYMQDEFLNLVQFGVYPKDAFSIVVFNGELN